MIMLKKILPYILIAVGAVILYNIFFTRYELKTDVENYERMIQQLEAKVDSLHSKNDILEFQADSLEIKLNESDTRIKQLNSRIYVIKKQTKQKVDAVDSMFDDELQKFFTDRYRQLNDKDSIN